MVNKIDAYKDHCSGSKNEHGCKEHVDRCFEQLEAGKDISSSDFCLESKNLKQCKLDFGECLQMSSIFAIAYGEPKGATGSKGKPVPKYSSDISDAWDLDKLDTAKDVSYMSADEKKVVLYLNMARSNPKLFAEEFLSERKSKGGAYLECYEELMVTKPMPLLNLRSRFTRREVSCDDMGKNGKMGHVGTDGSTLAQRVTRYGKFEEGRLGENCTYGLKDPVAIVVELLVDDGVKGRGHRKNILNSKFEYIGAAFSPHATFKTNCVQDFATHKP